jgi:hypothetical protein
MQILPIEKGFVLFPLTLADSRSFHKQGKGPPAVMSERVEEGFLDVENSGKPYKAGCPDAPCFP